MENDRIKAFRFNTPTIPILILLCICGTLMKPALAAQELDFGQFSETIYTHDFFGFKIEIPEDWVIQDKDSLERIANLGREMITGDDKNLEAVIKASELQVLNLLVAFKYPLGAPVDFNPSISIIAENVGNFPGITNGRDYLFHSKNLLQSSQMQVDFPGDPYKENIGGLEFDIMKMNLIIGSQTINQLYCVTIQERYAFLIIQTYGKKKELKEIAAIIETSSFE